MPGTAGSLLQMIEGAGTGATLDLDALPKPAGAPLERWLLTFPSFGFLLAAPAAQAGGAVEAFTRRGLAAPPAGRSTPPAGCASPPAATRPRLGPRRHAAHGADSGSPSAGG